MRCTHRSAPPPAGGQSIPASDRRSVTEDGSDGVDGGPDAGFVRLDGLVRSGSPAKRAGTSEAPMSATGQPADVRRGRGRYRVTGYQRRLLAAVAASTFFEGFDQAILALVAPYVARDFGLGPERARRDAVADRRRRRGLAADHRPGRSLRTAPPAADHRRGLRYLHRAHRARAGAAQFRPVAAPRPDVPVCGTGARHRRRRRGGPPRTPRPSPSRC